MTDLAALTGLGWDTVKNIIKDRRTGRAALAHLVASSFSEEAELVIRQPTGGGGHVRT